MPPVERVQIGLRVACLVGLYLLQGACISIVGNSPSTHGVAIRDPYRKQRTHHGGQVILQAHHQRGDLTLLGEYLDLKHMRASSKEMVGRRSFKTLTHGG
eukprot:scaffold741_cov336-Pavlova_lutheri.AAC.39